MGTSATSSNNSIPSAERPTGDHSVAAFQSLVTGLPIASRFLRDAMRGVDFLASRAEVDPNRIGAFGCSGGGTMTAYLGALDPRVKAVATACYVTDFDHLLGSIGPQDGEQSIPGFIAASLVDIDSGMTLAVKSTRADFDLGVASAYNSELVKQKMKIIKALNLKTNLEDMILTLGDQIHFIKVLSPTLFIYLAADRSVSNIAIVRTVVNKNSHRLG